MASISEQMAAAEMLLNRGYGRPAQAVTVKGEIDHVPRKSFLEARDELINRGVPAAALPLLEIEYDERLHTDVDDER